ncbi:gamma-type small acid-soluble spore protein [Rummeliibacillus sp. JY-2-4R]
MGKKSNKYAQEVRQQDAQNFNSYEQGTAGLYGQQEEFGAETNFNEVRQQNAKAKRNKQQASGIYSYNKQNNS